MPGGRHIPPPIGGGAKPEGRGRNTGGTPCGGSERGNPGEKRGSGGLAGGPRGAPALAGGGNFLAPGSGPLFPAALDNPGASRQQRVLSLPPRGGPGKNGREPGPRPWGGQARRVFPGRFFPSLRRPGRPPLRPPPKNPVLEGLNAQGGLRLDAGLGPWRVEGGPSVGVVEGGPWLPGVMSRASKGGPESPREVEEGGRLSPRDGRGHPPVGGGFRRRVHFEGRRAAASGPDL